MAVAKVIINGETKIDVTQKTVSANSLLSGVTALKNDGTSITGNITPRSSSDITASGATVTVPSGYYSSDEIKSVASGSVYTPETTITATPTISVSSTTGVITATNSKTQNVTPTVSAGYITSGTAGTITVNGSNTYSLPTKSEETYTPSTTTQVISANQFLTGAQTIAGDSNLVASNIVSGKTIFGVSGTYAPQLQPITVTPSATTQVFNPDPIIWTMEGTTSYQPDPENSTCSIRTSYTSLSQVPLPAGSYRVIGTVTRGSNVYNVDEPCTWSGSSTASFIWRHSSFSSDVYCWIQLYGGRVIYAFDGLDSTTATVHLEFHNATVECDGYSEVIVEGVNLQTKYVIPSGEQQIITADTGAIFTIPAGTATTRSASAYYDTIANITLSNQHAIYYIKGKLSLSISNTTQIITLDGYCAYMSSTNSEEYILINSSSPALSATTGSYFNYLLITNSNFRLQFPTLVSTSRTITVLEDITLTPVGVQNTVYSSYDNEISGPRTFAVDFSTFSNGDTCQLFFMLGTEDSGKVTWYIHDFETFVWNGSSHSFQSSDFGTGTNIGYKFEITSNSVVITYARYFDYSFVITKRTGDIESYYGLSQVVVSGLQSANGESF